MLFGNIKCFTEVSLCVHRRKSFLEDDMKLIKRNRNILLVAASCLLLMTLPVVSSAQGRGRGLGRGHNMSWKCGKFVNCHDARNGRWDGRGPRRSVRVFTPNGIFVSNTRRHRRFRNFDNDDRFRERRFRIRNRDFDNDDLFRQNRFRTDREFRNDNFFSMRGRGRHGR